MYFNKKNTWIFSLSPSVLLTPRNARTCPPIPPAPSLCPSEAIESPSRLGPGPHPHRAAGCISDEAVPAPCLQVGLSSSSSAICDLLFHRKKLFLVMCGSVIL